MKGKGSKTMAYVLMGLLVVGLGGFGIGSFGGNVSAVGQVGETAIDVNDYARALQSELRSASERAGRNVGLREAQTVGLDRQVLSQLVVTAALDEEARRLGLSVGDERVAQEIRNIQGFTGIDGGFDRQAYEFSLENNNLTPEEFEADIRAETSRSLLQAAVVGGVTVPDTFARTVFGYLAERRHFNWTRFTRADVTLDLGEPTTEDLTRIYNDRPEAFTLPETRKITYAHLSPEMLVDTIDIPEDELRAIYAERIDEYVQPERRILYRLVMPDRASAEAAIAAINAGEAEFESVVEDRGLTLDDVALGEVARDDLEPAVAEAVFALDDTGVIGPLSTDLGPALFRIAGLLNAQETSFAEMRDDLKAEAAMDRAARAVATEIEPIDDLLASGATLEELATETHMELGSIEMTATSDDGLAGYEAFRDRALAAQIGDFPEVFELDDGGLVAIRLDEVQQPRVQPMEEVTASVIDLWREAETSAAIRKAAEIALNTLDTGGSWDDIGKTPNEETLTRDAFIDGTPRALLAKAFALDPQGRALVDGNGETYLVELLEVLGPDSEAPDADFMRGILAQGASQGIARDMFQAYARAIQLDAGVQIDQAAINAVHAQFP